MKNPTSLALKSIPAILGLGFGWLGVQLIKNEKKILLRYAELLSVLEKSQSSSKDHLHKKEF